MCIPEIYSLYILLIIFNSDSIYIIKCITYTGHFFRLFFFIACIIYPGFAMEIVPSLREPKKSIKHQHNLVLYGIF